MRKSRSSISFSAYFDNLITDVLEAVPVGSLTHLRRSFTTYYDELVNEVLEEKSGNSLDELSKNGKLQDPDNDSTDKTASRGFIDEKFLMTVRVLYERYIEQLINDVPDIFSAKSSEKDSLTNTIKAWNQKSKVFTKKFYTPQFKVVEGLQSEQKHLSKLSYAKNGLICYEKADFSNQNLKDDQKIKKLHPSLIELVLKDNKFSSLDIISDFKQLKRVDISNNLVHRFPLLSSETVEWLDASNNLLTAINNLDLKNLKTLKLSRNKIETLGVAHLPSLEILDISYNLFSDLIFLPEIPQLSELYAGENTISDIKGLNGHSEVRIAHLRGNQLTEVPHLQCPKLSYLNLRKNNLSTIDNLKESLLRRDLPELKRVSVLENESLEIDSEAAKGFFAAGVQSFNKQKEED